MIDLHTHSIFSDGSLTPEQLVAAARRIGLKGLGLTDHDCTTGLDSFLRACSSPTPGSNHLEPVPGVEISVDVPKGTMHVLGYFIDPQYAELQEALEQIRDGRSVRNHKILQRLNELGLCLEWDEVASFAGADVVGRPHFAQALLKRGYVRSTQEAFDNYLAKGRPAYVDRFRLLPADAVGVIRRAGGLAVLAHPCTVEAKGRNLVALVRELKDFGLSGIEAYYSEHTPDQTAEYLAIAREVGLLVSGGSDFHGEANKAIALGYGFGSLWVRDEVLEELLRHREDH
ncbi:MAG: PHP domain-containing protein [Kiritimatiellia bacterium]